MSEVTVALGELNVFNRGMPGPESARDEPKTEKSRATRTKIVDTAIRLFTEHGYDKTTMRMIATEAGVSTGNAYHYFPSKDALMQGYYDDLAERSITAAKAEMDVNGGFADRLVATGLTWLETAAPFHTFGGSFLRFAADPNSALSPFSPESKAAREAMIQLFADVVDGSRKLKMAPELRPRLPYLLWLWHMGIVLFWVHDASDGQQKTKTLITKTAPVIDQLVNASRVPLLRRTAVNLLSTIDDVMGIAELPHRQRGAGHAE